MRSSARTGIGRWALATVGISCVLGVDPGAQDAGSMDAAQSDVLRVLVRAGERADPQRLARELAGVQADPVPALFELHVARGIPGEWSLEAGAALAPLDSAAREGVLLALGLRRTELLRFFGELAAGAADVPRRAAALSVLGRFGEAADLKLAVRLAVTSAAGGNVPQALRAAFAGALDECVRRGSAGPQDLALLLNETPLALGAVVVRSIADLESEPALLELARLLSRERALDALVLASIARAAQVVRHPIDPSVAGEVRRYLSSPDPELVQQAVVTAAKLEDYDALPELLGLAGSPGKNLRSAALDALRELARVDFGDEEERWSAWFESETTWWQEEADARFVELESGTTVVALRALGEISSARLFRHEVAEGLAAGLARREPSLVVALCRTLAGLRSEVALPDLVECLQREEPIRSAAWEALKSITGHDLAPDGEEWERFLEERTENHSTHGEEGNARAARGT